jgi:hypothetical protein
MGVTFDNADFVVKSLNLFGMTGEFWPILLLAVRRRVG